jgi:hypothetical protein
MTDIQKKIKDKYGDIKESAVLKWFIQNM